MRWLTVIVIAIATPGALGCGGGTNSKGASNQGASGSGSTQTGTAGQGGTHSSHQSPESAPNTFPGVYAETLRLCSQTPVSKVAHDAGTRSTNPTKIAAAMAHGYLPKYRAKAFSGCAAGLRVAKGLK